MLVHAQDAPLGILVSRHTAEDTLGECLLETSRVFAAFGEAPCAHTPKLHLHEVDEAAPPLDVKERSLVADLVGKSSLPMWTACVLPSRQARLGMDIVIHMAPSRATRRIQVFSSTHAAIAWLLTLRPEAHARLLPLLRDVEKAAKSSRITAKDLRHLTTPAPRPATTGVRAPRQNRQ